MTGLKPYLAMRDSGVPWLGMVPEHWGLERGKWLFTKMARPVRAGDDTVTCFRDGTVTLRKNRRLGGFTEALQEIGYQGVRRGDLVVHAMDAFAGAAGVSDSDGKCSPVYSVCKPAPHVTAEFYAHVVREMARRGWIVALGTGIRERSTDFRFTDFGTQWLPVPPQSEQLSIVSFLDHADRRIRRYIHLKRRLIDLLEEEKRAVIHTTVTRGLNPSVSVSGSGIDWLDDVPQHWSEARLKVVASDIVDCLHATPNYSADGRYPALRTADVTPGFLRINTARRIDEKQYRRWTQRLRPAEGDVVYTREGERFGIAALVPENVSLCISQRMMVFRIRSTHNSGYIMWQINCPHVYAQAAADLIGSAAPHVNVERIKNLRLLIPPRHEQDEIVAVIERESARIRMAMQRTLDEIALLREYRARLIADVVTGKLDVREAAATLPDEPDDATRDGDADLIEVDEDTIDEPDLDAVAEEAMA